jgi:rubrerythrin
MDLAVQLETRGESFYRQAAQTADNPAATALFRHLADEEVRHRELFLSLSSAIVVTEIDPITWEEAAAYIAATIDREFFGQGASIRETATASDVHGLIRQAISFEQQTLLYFYTLRDLVQPANRPLVERVIAEEREHVRRLSAWTAGSPGEGPQG